jgi:Aerotolerance regulator N-terminal/von Willebrand factor type A domain
MAFLAPFTLLGLLLVSLPFIIHLLVRRRGRRLDFPSLRFLRETPSFKLYPRRIRQPLLLALRAAAIILLVIGIARPLFTFPSPAPEAVRFILIDASLSMKTRGRAEAAREQARGIVRKLAKGERAGIIAVSSEATLLMELTEDRERLLQAIERYEPTGGAIDYDAGIAEISRQLQSEPPSTAQADIISDFQESGLQEKLRVASSLSISTHPIGAEAERNAFLLDEEVRKTARGLELSAAEIVAGGDGREAARHSWAVEASEGATSGIEWRTQANNQITGRIKVLEPDDFDADDERYFAFTPPGEKRVLLIEDGTDASLYLRAALEAAAGEEETARSVLDIRPRLPESASELAPYSLVVITLHGAARESETDVLEKYAEAGGTVWMFLARDLDTASWNVLAGERGQSGLPFESVARRSGSEALRFGAVDAEAPQLRGLDKGALAALGAVRLSESYNVTPRASSDILLRWSDNTPALLSTRVGRGTMLLLATSVERASGELALSPAFPALVSSTLRAASHAREPLSQTIGEAVRLNVAPDADVKIQDTKGSVVVAKARELVRRPLMYFKEHGIYRLEFAGQQKFLAFNAPAEESERALANGDKLKSHFFVNEAQGAKAGSAGNLREATERSGSVWRYFLCAAFLLILAELFVAIRQRKVVEG